MSAALSVLVVEDDEDIRNLLVTRLSRLGYCASAAATGEDGLAAALAEPPDLLLLDLLLPGIDGYEVARRLRRSPQTARVPVLVVSIVDDGDDHEVGVVGHLKKPFRARDVEAMVLALIGPAVAEGA
jgi:DNA-binding response OmpR family regulator